MKEIVIRQNREQLKKILGASALMTAISIVCFFFEGSFYKAASVAGTCFFGISFFYMLRLYLNPKTLFVLNKEGFRDCTIFSELGSIPWENIRDVSVETMDERKYLCLKCADMEEKIKSLQGNAQKAVYRNLKGGLEPISVLADAAEKKSEELKILILNYRDETLKD